MNNYLDIANNNINPVRNINYASNSNQYYLPNTDVRNNNMISNQYNNQFVPYNMNQYNNQFVPYNMNQYNQISNNAGYYQVNVNQQAQENNAMEYNFGNYELNNNMGNSIEGNIDENNKLKLIFSGDLPAPEVIGPAVVEQPNIFL